MSNLFRFFLRVFFLCLLTSSNEFARAEDAPLGEIEAEMKNPSQVIVRKISSQDARSRQASLMSIVDYIAKNEFTYEQSIRVMAVLGHFRDKNVAQRLLQTAIDFPEKETTNLILMSILDYDNSPAILDKLSMHLVKHAKNIDGNISTHIMNEIASHVPLSRKHLTDLLEGVLKASWE